MHQLPHQHLWARSISTRAKGNLYEIAVLAGAIGSCLAEDTELKPKTMVEIGGKPILWHILMHYAQYGHEEFVIALGHKGEVIKKYMLDCSSQPGSKRVVENGKSEDEWGSRSRLDGGVGRYRHEDGDGWPDQEARSLLGRRDLHARLGDGVADINLHDLLAFHRSHGKLATLTAVRPAARFGHLELEDDRIVEVSSQPQTKEGWINGAFFVLEPEVLDFIDGDGTHFEKEPLQRLAAAGQLMAYRHSAFWQCMDTLREKRYLESLWETGQAPWKTWPDAQ